MSPPGAAVVGVAVLAAVGIVEDNHKELALGILSIWLRIFLRSKRGGWPCAGTETYLAGAAECRTELERAGVDSLPAHKPPDKHPGRSCHMRQADLHTA